MDPYLEQHWLDVHAKLVTYAADYLNARLPPDLLASIEERVAVESEDSVRGYVPDVRVLEPQPGVEQAPGSGVGTAVAMPIRLFAQVDPITERFIKVVAAGTERLVTVIEFISPTNKRNPGLADIRGKRGEFLAGGVNFVEIDLVREGDWRSLLRPHVCPPRGISLYRATIRLPAEPAVVYLYPLDLRSPLLSIPIPLRPRDPEVRLDLQELIDSVYANGRYARRLDYSRPLEPSLSDDDAAWTKGLLTTARPS